MLIHIEIQSQRDADFERRMFVYHYRIFDLYNREVISLAVLGDGNANWRPEAFGYGRWGCVLSLSFRTVKLLDYVAAEPLLETQADPIAALVQAHLATLAEPNDALY